VQTYRGAVAGNEEDAMIRKFDHVTIVVREVEAAKRFFALLGFTEVKAVLISGKAMDDYMGVAGMEADHVTLASEAQ
jgi:catechol 2,3-dioxygenase-like lactoylglutathione lyase family enzyme